MFEDVLEIRNLFTQLLDPYLILQYRQNALESMYMYFMFKTFSIAYLILQYPQNALMSNDLFMKKVLSKDTLLLCPYELPFQ